MIGGLVATNGPHPLDGAVERGDHANPGPFRGGDEVRVGEVEAISLVDLDGALQEVGVMDADGREGEDRAQGGCDLDAGDLVERLDSATVTIPR
jgi:hypothetical protein